MIAEKNSNNPPEGQKISRNDNQRYMDQMKMLQKKTTNFGKITEISANSRRISLSEVGMRGITSKDVIGCYGERTNNNNGKRLTDFCIWNNLIVTNTFYQHKEMHKFTRQKYNIERRSLIDYIQIRKTLFF